MIEGMVAQVRSFNRTVTERVGALDEQYLGRGRSLGEARLLWEAGAGDGVELRELRRRLQIDSGYASRLLRSLEAQGLVDVREGTGDRRVRDVRLTAAGRAERAELDRLSDGLASAMLEPLDDGQRARLVTAMAEVERLLVASSITITPDDSGGEDAQWCLEQYFAELATRFRRPPVLPASVAAESGRLTPPDGLTLVARRGAVPLGCGSLKFHPDAPPDIKRMWVSPDARGLGLGRRLLRALEQRAQEAGATAIRLETNAALVEAIHMYRAAGYAEVEAFNDEPNADHWFEKQLP
jgi:DNA-binding MarR family transcriptional regulator/GNAT superfamily N-acetyltransferase